MRTYPDVPAVNVERRGGQFLLTEVEPELQDAATALGFARDGDAFARTFPEEAPLAREGVAELRS